MSVEGYAKFLTGMGHKVRKHGGVYWFNAHPHIYMSFPFDHLLSPDAIDLKVILESDGWAARFPCDLAEGRASYRIIADQPDYDLMSLSGKARNQTRRGLENCEVRPVDFQELLTHGMPLNRETLERQGRSIPATFESHWKQYYKHAALSDGAQAWGVFVENNLAAYLIAFVMDDVAHILIMRSSRSYLKQYPNNALLYSYLNHMLKDGKVKEVSIGLESIQTGMDSLDHFKEGMGFRKEPVGQRVALRPVLRMLAKKPVISLGLHMLAHLPDNEKASKLSGLLNWYDEQPVK